MQPSSNLLDRTLFPWAQIVDLRQELSESRDSRLERESLLSADESDEAVSHAVNHSRRSGACAEVANQLEHRGICTRGLEDGPVGEHTDFANEFRGCTVRTSELANRPQARDPILFSLAMAPNNRKVDIPLRWQ